MIKNRITPESLNGFYLALTWRDVVGGIHSDPCAAMAGALELELNENETYVKAAEPFWSVSGSSPAFLRMEFVAAGGL